MRTLKHAAVVAALSGLGAVSATSADLRLGAMAVFNDATISTNVSDLGQKPLLRQGAGVVIEVVATDSISFVFEPMYVGKGASVDPSKLNIDPGEFGLVNARGSLLSSYFEVPLWLKVGTPAGLVRPYLLAGPSLGIRMQAKARLRVDYLGQDIDSIVDTKSQTQRIDFGLGLGGGVSTDLGSFRFFAEGQYVLGLVDINRDADERFNNRGLLVRVGVTIALGGS
jgi:hypothetical protein